MNPTLLITGLPTPAGTLNAVITPEDGRVWATGYGPARPLIDELPLELRVRPVRPGPGPQDVRDAFHQFAEGDLNALSAVPIAERSTNAFTLAVWEALRAVEPGEVVTYDELAALAGTPEAGEAAAAASAANPLLLLIPSHRAIASDGTVGAFPAGEQVKMTLLLHEQRYRESADSDGTER